MRTKQNFIADKMLVLATSAESVAAATRVGRCEIVEFCLANFFLLLLLLLIQLGALLFVVTTVKLVFNSLAIFGDCGNDVAQRILIKLVYLCGCIKLHQFSIIELINRSQVIVDF